MSGECSFSWFNVETPKKSLESCDGNELCKSPKEALLQSLSKVEDTIKKLGYDALRERVNDLRGKVKDVLESQEEEVKSLRFKIKVLTDEVNSLKEEKEEVERKLALAQVTWAWEAHLARFVVNSSEEKIYKNGRFDQMRQYLRNKGSKDNLWKKIQNKVAHWTGRHWQVVNIVRKERNGIAHPDLVNFDFVESELAKISPEYQNKMKDMLNMLKMTASLMKFGRLARTYKDVDKLSPYSRKWLKDIISWDRLFEDIDGLQNIEHEEAKKFLQRYVASPENIRHYLYLVDLIKDENSKQMGKLAWKFEESYPPTNQETKDALEELKKLYLRRDHDDHNFKEGVSFGVDVARLHIPDFLPKNLWKHGIEIVGKYFDEELGCT